ncbi:E3 ubiquitin-protein ligase RNF126-like [Benincasa hispida]|uniref:E3 ubiquitin-protein ligase RNF126-like n=1 Tax=Benincasa hispida TaxID=102211 RepID=UPI0019025481|nr:E3 ubiquitin-protein ligase RNF126-like [Benincasa hispida]
MATVLPETTSAYAASYIMDIESMFDLDTVLTGADDFYYNKTVVAPPPVVVADLPTVAGKDVCAVCIEDFLPDESGKQIPCGHVYHQSCLSSWLSVGDSCPLCRRHIASDEEMEAPKTETVDGTNLEQTQLIISLYNEA